MIRKICMAILIVVTALVQCLLFQVFEIASIKPNLLLIVTISFGLMRGRTSGLLTGFFSGLALDIMFPGQLGMQALIYMWIGYLSGYCYRIFYDDDIKTPLMLVTLGDLVYGLYIYIGTFLIRGMTGFFFYLGRIIIPELLYTIMMTILLYRPLHWLNKLISRTDKRSIDSLV